eukprot:NODE_39_length_3130_cov_55.062967_g35_i0.p1 GENE.NODE_39_length_3130_cov_55.062967_g35_i0~~NODE_39_length_3130_cov_55.062967_g35_i0.p1  ORF type:complete len:405 (-),score=85.87 NODE_39_length_3130_cov_55.062967_g35_i0:1542-2756(-)
MGGYLNNSPQNQRDYLVWDHPYVYEYDQLELAIETFKASQGEETPQAIRSGSQELWMMQAVYETRKGEDNIWTPANVRNMKAIEEMITAEDGEWKNFCFAESVDDASCSKNEAVFSPLGLFSDYDVSSITQEQINKALQDLVDDDSKWSDMQMFFDINFDKTTLKGIRTRAIFNFGAPIQDGKTRYKTEVDRQYEQELVVAGYQDDLQKDIDNDFQTKQMKTVLFSGSRRMSAFTKTMFGDINYAGFSIIFVVGFICFHTRSFFLGFVGMLLIILSFPVTGVIFGLIGQIAYFQVLQMMVIFIILGIAADDIFVVVDAWNQSALFAELKGANKMETKVKRMSYTLRRSAFAIAVTSSTTSVAFLANVNSKLMPIKAFGAFAAIIVLVNYFLFVFYFPCILMFWD